MMLPWEDVEDLGDINSPYAPGYRVAWDICYASFTIDYAQIQSVKDIIVGAIPSSAQGEWGSAIANRFMIWRQNVPPTMPALLMIAAEHFEIPQEHPFLKVALAAAVLSEIEHLNAYHNSHHFREVMTMAIRLAATHNEIATEEDKLNDDDILKLLTAAAVHDFSHDGQGNVWGGVHYPSRLEQRAIDQVKPFLIAAGCSEDDFQIIAAMIISTDVSHGDGGGSPADVMRDIYKVHHKGGDMPACGVIFYPLIKDKKSALLALILGEADIAPSTGLSYEFSQVTTILVAQESDVLKPSAMTLYGFMQRICREQYLSPAARHLMAENFTSISLYAEQDSESGALYA